MMAIRKLINTWTKHEEAKGQLPTLEVTMEDFELAIERIKKQRNDQNMIGDSIS